MNEQETALDDLDAALARMQGDDSGGPLTPALDAARRVRAERDFAAKTEHRIRREVRALGYPMLGAAAMLISDDAKAWWAQLGYGVFALAMLLTWASNRPALPGDSTPMGWVASIREHPLLWSVTAALAVAAGVSFGMAVSTRNDDPAGTFWLIAATLLLVLSGAWLTFIVSRSRRRPDAQQPTEAS